MTVMQAQAANDNRDLLTAQEDLSKAFARVLAIKLGPEPSFAEVEATGLGMANGLCRESQQNDLERRAARWTSEQLLIDGKLYRHHEEGSEMVHGLCGSFRVERPTYRQVGVHNGPIVVPLDLDAGLLTGATPALAFKLCEGYGQAPSREVHKALLSSHRLPPSRSTTERIAKALGGELGSEVARIEPVIRTREAVPEGAHGISVGLDRTSAPMEEPLDAAAKSTRVNRRTKPYVRRAPEPVEVNYRMAYVGTVSVVDVDGRALVTRRYGTSADNGPADIIERMMADVGDLHGKRPNLPVGLVQDGAAEMWNLMRGALGETLGTSETCWFEAIDRHHVLERVSNALLLVKEPPAVRAKLLSEWNRRLDSDDSAIDTIEKYIIGLRDHHSGKVREDLDEHVTYFANNKDRMRYATLRERGLPVGSGATEGACKSLVMVRAKGCGQRWHPEGLDAVLTLRGLDMSERLAPVFDLFAREKVASIRVAA